MVTDMPTSKLELLRRRAVICVLLLIPAQLDADCQTERPLDQLIPAYEGQSQSLIDHIYSLGRITKVCFGVEALPPAAVQRVERLDLRNVTLGQALNKLLAGLRDVRVEEAGGLVLIRLAGPQQHNWLDYNIRSFQSRRDSLQPVSNLLFMTLVMQADPSVQGFAGSFPPGDITDLAGPFHEEHKSLREILNALLLGSKGGMWVTDRTLQYGTEIPRKPFWVFQQYARPDSDPGE